MPSIAVSPTTAISQPAELLELAGFPIAGHYGDPEAEYRAVLSGAGVFDRSAWGRLRVTGERPQAWLNGIVSNDTNLKPGEGCRALLLTIKGRIACDLNVHAVDDGLWIGTAFDTAAGLAENLRRLVLYGDRIEVEDVRPETFQFTVAGPQAAAVVRHAVGADVDDLKPGQVITTDDVTVWATRLGEPRAYDVVAPLGQAEARWCAFTEQAQPYGWRAAELLRIAAGLPRWGAELTGDVLPLEAELEEALSHSKGCYPGQEIVARMRDRGHANRLLRLLAMQGEVAPRRDATLSVPGDPRPVGMITSAAAVPDEGVRALAYVKSAAADPGVRLELTVPGGDVVAAEVMLAHRGWRP